jgi:hypothetical protein
MLVLVFSAAMLTVYARFAWVTCIEHVTHKRITTNNNSSRWNRFQCNAILEDVVVAVVVDARISER